jgi:hypothetical protein
VKSYENIDTIPDVAVIDIKGGRVLVYDAPAKY